MKNILIKERKEHWSNFFTPAVIICCSSLLVALISYPLTVLLLIQPFITIDEGPLFNLIIMLLYTSVGALVINFTIIPRFGSLNGEYVPLKLKVTLKTLVMACLAWTLVFASALIMNNLYILFDLDQPQTGYTQILLTEELITPVNILLLLCVVSITTPVIEELVYRRLLIPLLEERGMSPRSAVLLSTLVFTLAHVPNDLLNGNLTNAVNHFLAVFIVGLVFGISYIYTRNVKYPILIHGFVNFISFLPSVILLMENWALLTVYGIALILILVIGSVSGVYVVWKYFMDPDASLARILKKKSPVNILPGSCGFLIIFLGFFAFDTIYTHVLYTLISDELLALILSAVIYSLLLLGLFWLIKNQTTYTGYGKIIPVIDGFEKDSLKIDSGLKDLINLSSAELPESRGGKAILAVESLKKYFGSVKAVDGLSLSVKPGEIYGLLGPNGAGKSTTIKSILGLLEIDAGSISVFGDDPIKTPSRVKKNIGYVPEEFSLYESMTVAELLDFVASLRRLDSREVSLNADELLKSLDAKKYYDSLIASLSQGNKQKIQIICALLHRPKLLILDEPLSGLDARSAKVLKEIFRIHINRGGSIILSTHVMEQAQALCDRIGIINQGKMVAEGTFEELQKLARSTGATLEEVFLELTDQTESTNGIIENLKRLASQAS